MHKRPCPLGFPLTWEDEEEIQKACRQAYEAMTRRISLRDAESEDVRLHRRALEVLPPLISLRDAEIMLDMGRPEIRRFMARRGYMPIARYCRGSSYRLAFYRACDLLHAFAGQIHEINVLDRYDIPN